MAGSDKDSSDDEMDLQPITQKGFRSKVIQLIATEKWSNLLEFDELNRELQAGRMLPGFTAPAPKFPPTFKRVRNQKIEFLSDFYLSGNGLQIYFFYDDLFFIPEFLFIFMNRIFY